jgi:integrase
MQSLPIILLRPYFHKGFECIGLRLVDIESKRMMIHIHVAKGKKDRMVPLSKVLLETLRE